MSHDLAPAILDRRQSLRELRLEISKIEAELVALEKAAEILGVFVADVGSAVPGPTSLANDAPNDAPNGVVNGRNFVPRRKLVFHEAVRPRGRAKGAISREWREVLEALYALNQSYTYGEIQVAASSAGTTQVMASVRDRVRKFVEAGLMEKAGDSRFAVTQKAAEQFGFAAARTSPENSSEFESNL